MKSFIFLPMFLLYTGSTLITPKKLCINCKHFIANKRECAVFGETDLVEGKNDYIYASSARRDEKKCGEEAVYFEENDKKFITVPYYFLLDKWAIVILLWFYCSFMWLCYRIVHL
jgi:hypothetical protein